MIIRSNVENLINIYQQKSSFMQVIPTNQEADLRPLKGIKAVLFDVYGTLFISGSGDISHADKESAKAGIFQSIFSGILNLDIKASKAEEMPTLFQSCLKAEHTRLKELGKNKPEMDIRRVWQLFLEKSAPGFLENFDDDQKYRLLEEIAVHFEVASNPVWPFPDTEACLRQIQTQKLHMGIVSNAQFYTPLMFSAFFGKNLEELGFNPALCSWSFISQESKPAKSIFRPVLDQLCGKQGLKPEEIVYIGNDCRNDVMGAALLGLKTILFAGDQRSLRLRQDDPQVSRYNPDRIVRTLTEISSILFIGD